MMTPPPADVYRHAQVRAALAWLATHPFLDRLDVAPHDERGGPLGPVVVLVQPGPHGIGAPFPA